MQMKNQMTRKTGTVCEFMGRAPIKYGQRSTPNGLVLTLETNKNYEVRYTTDGSEPKENGGLYNGEIVLPEGCKYIRTVSIFNGQIIDNKDIQVDTSSTATTQKKIDPDKSVFYRMKAKKQLGDTESVYQELEALSKLENVFIKGASAYIYEKGKDENYVEYNAAIPYLPIDFQNLIDLVRDSSFKNREVVVTFEYKELMFIKGSNFMNWVEMRKLDMDNLRKEGEIIQ